MTTNKSWLASSREIPTFAGLWRCKKSTPQFANQGPQVHGEGCGVASSHSGPKGVVLLVHSFLIASFGANNSQKLITYLVSFPLFAPHVLVGGGAPC